MSNKREPYNLLAVHIPATYTQEDVSVHIKAVGTPQCIIITRSDLTLQKLSSFLQNHKPQNTSTNGTEYELRFAIPQPQNVVEFARKLRAILQENSLQVSEIQYYFTKSRTKQDNVEVIIIEESSAYTLRFQVRNNAGSLTERKLRGSAAKLIRLPAAIRVTVNVPRLELILDLDPHAQDADLEKLAANAV